MEIQHLYFDIIYENSDQNSEKKYRMDLFLVNIPIGEIKFRYTKKIPAMVVLQVLPPRLSILSKLFYFVFYMFLARIWSVFIQFQVFSFVIRFHTVLSFHFCKLFILIPRINKDFINLFFHYLFMFLNSCKRFTKDGCRVGALVQLH